MPPVIMIAMMTKEGTSKNELSEDEGPEHDADDDAEADVDKVEVAGAVGLKSDANDVDAGDQPDDAGEQEQGAVAHGEKLHGAHPF